MNFSNHFQKEPQDAMWLTNQTMLHGTVNIYRCTQPTCTKLVHHCIVHVTDNKKHDSFLARACQRMNLDYLSRNEVPITELFQYADNCSAQYKSRRPFAELLRMKLKITRIFMEEKHGKGLADALFGRLKNWMTQEVKAGKATIRHAEDFYLYCIRHYPQGNRDSNGCRHSRTDFEYVFPQNICREEDPDVKCIEGTRKLYSVRNTSNALEIQVR